MNFTDIVENTIEEAQKITIDSFIETVASYGSLDDAVLELDDDMLQFYSNNLRVLDKLLKKRDLMESIQYGSPGEQGYHGWSRSGEDKTKTIKYRGHLISLAWDAELGTWQPTVRFRSVSESLKYGKKLVDEWELK